MSEGKAGSVSVSPLAIAMAGSLASTPAGAVALAVAGTAVLAISAAAAAALVTRATMTGVVALSDRLETDAANWKQEQRAADDWAEAVRAVAARNAHIGSLRAAMGKARQASQGQPGIDLPTLCSPAGRTLPELTAWCERTDRMLAKAEGALVADTIGDSLARLARLPGGNSLVPVAAAIANQYSLLAMSGNAGAAAAPAAERAPQGRPGRPTGGKQDLDGGPLTGQTSASIGRQLARLPRDVSAEDYAGVLEVAAKAREAKTAQIARAWLTELQERVKVAKEHADRRRDDVLAARRYLSALRLEEIDATLFPPTVTAPYSDTRRRLEAVLAGDERMSPQLRLAAEEAVLQARQAADDAFVTAQIRAVLGEMGYAVSKGAAGALTVFGPDLGDVTALVELSGGQLRADLRPGTTGIGAGRVAKWRRAVDQLQRSLAGAGIQTELTEVSDSTADEQHLADDEKAVAAQRYRERPR